LPPATGDIRFAIDNTRFSLASDNGRGATIRKILHSRLPQRWAHRVPPALVEAAIGVTAAVLMVACRVLLEPFIGDRAPYALNFLAVVSAAVLAGWRGGLLALIVGQLLVWYLIIPPTWSFQPPDSERLGGLGIATLSQALILLVIALYQREVDKGIVERERRLELMNHALNEIDHRTRNNHQTVLALIHLQAQRSKDDGVKAALAQVADRIQAIAHASDQLALRSGDLESVRLDDHLCGLCEQIERGLSRQNVNISCDVEEIITSAEKAIPIAIIVNELVTNALKHAFDGRDEGQVRVTGRLNGEIKLSISDNGKGISGRASSQPGGLGTKLVENFARQLGARHEVVSSESGTTHALIIPAVE
jgi:two-component system, sensor histidine kinase PdtaS